MKTCWGCKNAKPFEAFSKCSSSKDGHQKLCKACLSKYNAARNYAPVEDGEKTCPKCQQTLHVSAFGAHKRHRDGRQTVCKKCAAVQCHAYWSSSEERKWKHKARAKVRSEVRAGRMKPQPCAKCGAARAQAHHHKGYAIEHWLDVEWLCIDCHSKEHANVA